MDQAFVQAAGRRHPLFTFWPTADVKLQGDGLNRAIVELCVQESKYGDVMVFVEGKKRIRQLQTFLTEDARLCGADVICMYAGAEVEKREDEER